MNSPYFSIIIPTLNEEANLPILLGSLSKQTFRDFEVIIGDCGSKDNTEKNAQKFHKLLPCFLFTKQSRHSIGAARNNGAKHAKGKYFVFLDADTKAEKDFLQGIKKHVEEDKVDFLTVWNRSEKDFLTGKLVFALLNNAMSLFAKIKPGANGPCMIVSRELFEKIKGFDPDIVFGEDFDFAQRAHKAGCHFGVYKFPVLYVSTRRFEKEGFFKSLYKSLRALAYENIFGPIKKPIFEYEMGGQYYKK